MSWKKEHNFSIIWPKTEQCYWHNMLLLLAQSIKAYEGRVEVGKNGENSEGAQQHLAAEFASLVVLLCISRVCQFRATENATKTQNTSLRTYSKLSLFIFLTLYQHLRSKGAKFCVL